jgi:hypothetical protein
MGGAERADDADRRERARSTAWPDDGWDAPTHIRSASAPADAVMPTSSASLTDRASGSTSGAASAAASPGASTSGATSAAASPGAYPAATVNRSSSRSGARAGHTERGIAGWQAVLVLVAISAVGGVIDVARGSSVKGGFNIALIVASVVAILLVRRSQMFPVLVAPPLVYFIASAGMLYVRSSGLQDRSRLLDAAINWLVYGFPAIAGATAAVLIIGGIRLLLRR